MQVTTTVLASKSSTAARSLDHLRVFPPHWLTMEGSRARNPFHSRVAFIEFLSFSKSQLPIFINLIIAIPLFNWIQTPFDIVFVTVFHQILNFFFVKIECDLYFLDRFDVLMSKIIFKK
jgi:hypothetical protein